jgi:hypothetical protein
MESYMKSVVELEKEIESLHHDLTKHSLYKKIETLDDLRIFMETHVYAVWDFMTLLKRIQLDITCVTLPWRPSPYPKQLVRLVNEIVLGEESDMDQNGQATDHFSLYIQSMLEINANTSKISKFISNLDLSSLPKPIENFVSSNLDVALTSEIHKVAGVFFFGREKLIPDMFSGILNDIWLSGPAHSFPTLKYYLERHVQLDGGEHSHLASEMLKTLCQGDENKYKEALDAGIQALRHRINLWNFAEAQILANTWVPLSETAL